MKRRKLKVTRELLELLSDAQFSEFKMLNLRDSFESRYGLGECSNSSELRKWLYRRILPLVKRGYLIKTSQGDEQAVVYQINDQFKKTFQLHCDADEPKKKAESMKAAPENSQIRALSSKLSQYQVDMYACAGECKEYQQLAVDYPHLRDQIEPMYRSARERSSELMGQLRAINNLLEQTGSAK
tara:strand:- start:11827 stop:12378 length:552 start_codon:yes stop_codon:yes gene_type:complete